MGKKKTISKQQSGRDIYNVGGDVKVDGNMDLRGATLINSLVFVKGDAIESELMKVEQQKLIEGHTVSFLDFLKEDFSGRQIIHRQVVIDVWNELAAKEQILLTGAPGSGKSCILFQLSSIATDVVYLSMRDRSSLYVFNHLINKIRINQKEVSLTLNDPDQAFDVLQRLLLSSSITFLIDDCESSTALVSKLISLRKGKNRFVFASRNGQLFDGDHINAVPAKAFTEEEAEQYLKLCGMNLDMLSFNALYQASGGNALYLFYFSNYQLSSLPTGIDDYHKAIWAGLTADEKECLIFIALAYRLLDVKELQELMNDRRLTETMVRLTKLAGLVNNQKGMLEIFHPAFKEYINSRIHDDGLRVSYSEKLGLYFLDKQKLVDAAWLLINSLPKKVNGFGLDALPAVIISGDLPFAIKLIRTLLEYQKTGLNLGYLEYHLSSVYRMQHKDVLSETHLINAIGYFKKIKVKHWLLSAEMMQAMNLVEKGKNEEGLALADSIFKRSGRYGDRFKAMNLVNLTKIYIDLTEYEKGAIAGKEAFDIFEKNNDINGMASSLANLASCLAKMDDYDEQAEAYALKLLSLKKNSAGFHVRLIALNILTSINRTKKNFKDAKKYGKEIIKLCQQFELPDKLVLNLINYGNIVRDEKKLPEAIKIYEEALGHATELQLKRDEGRIYWILSSVYRQQANYDKSLEYVDRSIKLSKQVNYKYGIAHATESKGKTLEKKGDKAAAAAAFEESARLFLTIDNFSKDTKNSFAKATKLYTEVGDIEKAKQLLALSIMDAPNNNFEEIGDTLNEAKGSAVQGTIHESYLQLAHKYGETNFKQNTVRKFLVYLDYCQKNIGTSTKPFLKVLLALASHTGTNRFALTTLGILTEQSKKLLNSEGLDEVIKFTATKIVRLNYRDTTDEAILLASVTDKLKIQAGAVQGDVLALKLLFTSILFSYAAPELIVDTHKSLTVSHYNLQAISRQMLESDGRSLSIPAKEFNEHVQTLMIRNPEKSLDMVYINGDYEKMADLNTKPSNKCLMWYLGIIVRGSRSHLYEEKNKLSRDNSKQVARKFAYFFDYTNHEDVKKMKQAFDVNLDKI